MSLNRIVIIGRLCADPEERCAGDGMELSKFRVAVNRPKARDAEEKADFFNVVCFRHTAKFVNQYLRKGNLVCVDGRLNLDEYTDREGVVKTWIEIAANDVQNLTPRAESGEATPPRGQREPDREFEDRDPGPRRALPRQRDRFDRDEEDSAPRRAWTRDELEPTQRRSNHAPTTGQSQRGRGYANADDDGEDPFADS